MTLLILRTSRAEGFAQEALSRAAVGRADVWMGAGSVPRAWAAASEGVLPGARPPARDGSGGRTSSGSAVCCGAGGSSWFTDRRDN